MCFVEREKRTVAALERPKSGARAMMDRRTHLPYLGSAINVISRGCVIASAPSDPGCDIAAGVGVTQTNAPCREEPPDWRGQVHRANQPHAGCEVCARGSIPCAQCLAYATGDVDYKRRLDEENSINIILRRPRAPRPPHATCLLS